MFTKILKLRGKCSVDLKSHTRLNVFSDNTISTKILVINQPQIMQQEYFQILDYHYYGDWSIPNGYLLTNCNMEY